MFRVSGNGHSVLRQNGFVERDRSAHLHCGSNPYINSAGRTNVADTLRHQTDNAVRIDGRVSVPVIVVNHDDVEEHVASLVGASKTKSIIEDTVAVRIKFIIESIESQFLIVYLV